MYDVRGYGAVSKPVVQRDIGRPVNIHVRCPQREACQLVVYDSRVWHDFRHDHVLVEERMASCRMLCNGLAKIILEEDIFHSLIFLALETVHGERARCGRSRVLLSTAKFQEADTGLCMEVTSQKGVG